MYNKQSCHKEKSVYGASANDLTPIVFLSGVHLQPVGMGTCATWDNHQVQFICSDQKSWSLPFSQRENTETTKDLSIGQLWCVNSSQRMFIFWSNGKSESATNRECFHGTLTLLFDEGFWRSRRKPDCLQVTPVVSKRAIKSIGYWSHVMGDYAQIPLLCFLTVSLRLPDKDRQVDGPAWQ